VIYKRNTLKSLGWALSIIKILYSIFLGFHLCIFPLFALFIISQYYCFKRKTLNRAFICFCSNLNFVTISYLKIRTIIISNRDQLRLRNDALIRAKYILRFDKQISRQCVRTASKNNTRFASHQTKLI